MIETAGLASGAAVLGLILAVLHTRDASTNWLFWSILLLVIVWTSLRQRLRGGTLASSGAAAVALGAAAPARVRGQATPPLTEPAVRHARLKQSVCRWCYRDIPLRDFCRGVAGIGLTAIDLLQPEEWPIAREFGLTCSMGYAGGGTITDGLNDPANHETIVTSLTQNIPKAASLGVPNVIAFFGNRRGRPDPEAIDHCATALRRVSRVAEDHGVTICVELLNSKVDHKDYQGDRTGFGVAVVEAVGSPRVKLLYDIYHMQIMEGDVIRTIRDHRQAIAHFHTGGVPGRHELDDTQELNWPAIARAIVETGFTGYYAHEFIPTRDPLTSLREAVVLCDV
jgi:hydroxypyruvate isomerase